MLSLVVFEVELLQIKHLMHWEYFTNHNADYCHKQVRVGGGSVFSSLTIILK